jgi:curved DNA-binding protein CbpA
MDLNPYEELGVERDADAEAIRRAYRSKAKSAHPDAGGDGQEWERVSVALAVLTDPKKRKAYDDTGRIEDDRPDNDRAAALQVIEQQMGQVVNAYIGSGFDISKDPRRRNVVASVRTVLEREIVQAEDGIAGGRNVIEFMTDMAKRFTIKAPGPDGDPIVRGFERQIHGAQQQIADLEASIRVRRIAITIVEGYAFRSEQPPEYEPCGFGNFTLNNIGADGVLRW